jgi:hypothetical protein
MSDPENRGRDLVGVRTDLMCDLRDLVGSGLI